MLTKLLFISIYSPEIDKQKTLENNQKKKIYIVFQRTGMNG